MFLLQILHNKKHHARHLIRPLLEKNCKRQELLVEHRVGRYTWLHSVCNVAIDHVGIDDLLHLVPLASNK
jgi:hypothetical protein